jgi:tripartite-type tricarboxylate transporter receptor subunit TctC
MKKILLVLGVVAAFSMSCNRNSKTEAEDKYPTQPIRVIIPNAPGGAIETVFRKFQAYVEKELGTQLMIENMDGGGGIIGTTVLQKAPPDGYTIQAKSQGSLINSWVLMDADFTIDDFDYLARFSNDPGVVLVRKDAPYNTLTEFITWVKTQPEGSVTMSLANITDINYLGLKQIESAAGIKFNIVGYNGGGAARLAIVKGEVVGTHCNYFGASAVWDDTKVLAVHLDENTVPRLKGVQTVNEGVGKKTQAISTYFELLAPKGFMEQYPARAQKLLDAFNTAWNNPEFLAAMKASDQEGYIDVIGTEEARREMYEVNAYIESNKELFSIE